jgi:hypothetical protein
VTTKPPDWAASTSVPGKLDRGDRPRVDHKGRSHTTFGNGGPRRFSLHLGHDRFMAVTVAKDGSIYAAGYVTQGGTRRWRWRSTGRGRFDKSSARTASLS